MSETAACHTLGEGVALARAVEESGKIYMFAENYPYMVLQPRDEAALPTGPRRRVQIRRGRIRPPPTHPEVKLAAQLRPRPLAQLDPLHVLLHPLHRPSHVHHRHPAGKSKAALSSPLTSPTQPKTLHMNRSDTAAVII